MYVINYSRKHKAFVIGTYPYQFAIEYCLKWSGLGASLMLTDENIILNLTVLIAELYFSVPTPVKWSKRSYKRAKEKMRTRKFEGYYAHQLDLFGSRRTGFLIDHGVMWLEILKGEDWSKKDKKRWPWNGNGWRFAWYYVDWLLGPKLYIDSKTAYKTTLTEIAGKNWVITYFNCTRSRKRLPWLSKKFIRLRFFHKHKECMSTLVTCEPALEDLHELIRKNDE